MNDEIKPSDLVLHEPFLEAIKAGIEEYSEDVVYWSWQNFFVAFLPFAAVLMAEAKAAEQAKRYGMDIDQALDAIALVGNLRGASDPHKSWLAAEIIMRQATPEALENLMAALAPAKGQA